ncbi:hypothetical protein BGW38_007012 [Lunasporangiospora selenospora]|uniref:RRM domain-containing protein n=1 Tax=Lunasporangiospora selenospora TaxID=979761 RepID=A0A9P6FL71_9FUNG|nr:hypothetical protein BGW38_007012 [Lunasporangiospora selenospora]
MATPKNKPSVGGVAAMPGMGSMNSMGAVSNMGAMSSMGNMGSVSSVNGNMPMTPTQYGYSPAQTASPQHPVNQHTDPNNTTVFVGGLSGPVHEDELRGIFAVYGEITYVKIPPGKGCGFVQFVHRPSAEMAIQHLNGYQIGNSRIRLSWGRAQNEPKPMSPHSSSMMGNTSFRPQMSGHFGMGTNRTSGSYNGYPGFMSGSTTPGMMATQSIRDPMERVPVEQQNRVFIERKEAIMSRMDDSAGWRGSGAIYA